MKFILIMLSTVLVAEAGTLRVSKVAKTDGHNTEAMRHLTERGARIYPVETKVILTGKDVKSAKVVTKRKGVIEVILTEEGARKLSKITEGANGTLRLAIVIDDVLECVPLVQSELNNSFWISGLEDRDAEGLQRLTKSFETFAEIAKTGADGE